jgi:adenosylcobyric acid synthase
MKAAIQICGTGSGVGKSIIVAGLCRIFLQDGYSVCPFKAQNMSLNSFVTKEGQEMSRAQVVQAQACRIEPRADMNPILIKPTTDTGAQIIIQGRPFGNISARQYQNKPYKVKIFEKVKASFNALKKEYEIIVIEGAGSPAEINLKSHDIVNMRMAQFANASVLLAGDIDKGGVFASLIGTLELLEEGERKKIKGFIINKFRGDKTLLKDGIKFLEKRTKKPVLAVIPYFKDIKIPEEDSVPLEYKMLSKTNCRASSAKLLDIAVIKLPHISNFTDFDALQKEPDVKLRYVTDKSELNNPDIIIIPGTKNTIRDLQWLKDSGIAKHILARLNSSNPTTLFGICGGYQMLGQKIYDLDNIESNKKQIEGLGIFPIVTHFKKEKILCQVKAKEMASGLEVSGYEIHHGRSKNLKKSKPFFKLIERQGKMVEDFDGMISENGRTQGTYIHGVFDANDFRRDFLNRIRLQKGWSKVSKATGFNLDREFNKLANLVRENMDMKLLYRILNHEL